MKYLILILLISCSPKLPIVNHEINDSTNTYYIPGNGKIITSEYVYSDKTGMVGSKLCSYIISVEIKDTCNCKHNYIDDKGFKIFRLLRYRNTTSTDGWTEVIYPLESKTQLSADELEQMKKEAQ